LLWHWLSLFALAFALALAFAFRIGFRFGIGFRCMMYLSLAVVDKLLLLTRHPRETAVPGRESKANQVSGLTKQSCHDAMHII
jgi:hypothetical protein